MGDDVEPGADSGRFRIGYPHHVSIRICCEAIYPGQSVQFRGRRPQARLQSSDRAIVAGPAFPRTVPRETRPKVEAAFAALGFTSNFFAKALISSRTNTIGILTSGLDNEVVLPVL